MNQDGVNQPRSPMPPTGSNPDAPILKHATLNPYRHAAFELWQRLKWDLQPESWRSRRRLRAMRHRHWGQKAVILGNGPSLLKSDLSLLDGVFTFGLNKINLLFDQSDFRPSCIVAVNSLVLQQNADFYNRTTIPLFLDSGGLRWVRSRPTITYLHSSSQPKFPQDCSISLFQGATVTFVALELAFHLGFTEVALIGCDHHFTVQGAPGQAVVAGARDDNHFAPNYFANGVSWHLPDLFRSEVAYTLAREMYAATGRKLVNATEGGHLEIFSRQPLADFLQS